MRLRHDGIYRVDGYSKSSVQGAASRWSGPGQAKRTRRKEHALPIARDEFRPAIPRSGCSPASPVSASPARPEYNTGRIEGNELSSNGKQCLNCLSQPKGQPQGVSKYTFTK
jgi:hypothetical protein